MGHKTRIGSVIGIALSFALVGALALPAAAHHKDGHEGGQGQSASEAQGKGTSEGRSQNQAGSKAQGKGTSEGRSQAGSQNQGKGTSEGRSQAGSQNQGKAGAQSQGQGQRARGTVKIRSTGVADGDHRNEPHPGCIFWTHFWGFDEREVVATFRAHPPTGGNRDVLLTDVVQLPGPAQTVSGSYNLAPIFESLGIAPHPNQGYHVKLQVTSTDGRHLTKHKVFWIKCPVEPAVEPGVVPPDEVGGDVIIPPEQIPPDEVQPDVITAPVAPDQVLPVRLAAPAAPEARPAAAEERRPAGVLPVTGADALAFLWIALALIGAGLLLRARRNEA